MKKVHSKNSKMRLRRLFNTKSGRIFLIPLDHGVTLGPIGGIENIRTTVKKCLKDPVDGLIMHKGCISQNSDIFLHTRDVNLILHLSASVVLSGEVDSKVLIGDIEEAIRLGADAVSIHVNLGVQNDREMLEALGRVSSECTKWNIPLIAMMYSKNCEASHENTAIAARVAMEMGADIIKINYTGDKKAFRTLCETIGVPIVVAGGEKKNSVRDFFQDLSDALECGASGIAAGRNIFQYEYPEKMIKCLDLLLNKSVTVDEVMNYLENEIIKIEINKGIVNGERKEALV